MKNILIIASLTKIATANSIVRSFRRSGFNIYVYSDIKSPLADASGPCLPHVGKLVRKTGFSPDLLLFIEGGTMELFPVGLDDITCLTAWYGIDTHMDYQKHYYISKVFDITFLTQYQYVELMRKDGIEQVVWLPLAFDENHASPITHEHKKFDISYVGSMDPGMHPRRHELITAIAARYPNHYFGHADAKEMYKIYGNSKIVFNYSINNDINMRFFEAMGNGAVLVTNPVINNGIEQLFSKIRAIVEYTDKKTLYAAIDGLLADDVSRKQIGDHARQLILESNTYDHRVYQIADTAQKIKKHCRLRFEDYLNIFMAMKHIIGLLWIFNLSMQCTKIHPAKKIAVGCIQSMLLIFRKVLEYIYLIRNRKIASESR